MGDLKVCELECLDKGKKKTGPRHEFVGPVKIVLIESTEADYQRKIWGSAVFTFVMLLMGATVFTVLFFSLSFKLPFIMNVHIVLCTIGFQLFMTTGIMMFSSLFGGSMYLKLVERKYQHVFLEIFAVLFGVLGSLFALARMAFTLHAITGFLTACLAVASGLVGPTVYVADAEKLFGLFNKEAHRKIAVPTFVLSTICFALGLIKSSFIEWAPVKNLHLILLLFTFLYSGIAVSTMFLRLRFNL